MTSEQLNAIEARADAATNGPWDIWDGPEFTGGGADLCIGSGPDWIASMDHRYSKDHGPQCASKDSVDVCSFSDVASITKEQRATAEFIRSSREDVPALVAEVRRLQRELDAAVEHAGSLLEQRNEARAWAEKTVQEAVSGRTVTCVYCGMEYGEGTPAAQDERLTAHIKQCEKHPMRALERKVADLKAGIAAQAQKVHQAYHHDEIGTWKDCPKDVCGSARTFLDVDS